MEKSGPAEKKRILTAERDRSLDQDPLDRSPGESSALGHVQASAIERVRVSGAEAAISLPVGASCCQLQGVAVETPASQMSTPQRLLRLHESVVSNHGTRHLYPT